MDITYFAETNFRNRGEPFGIKRADRRSHFYLIGRTGTGKSTLLKTLIREDLQRGEGLALLDPHGELATEIALSIPEGRKGDVLYLNLPDHRERFGFNPFRGIPQAKRPLAAAGMVEVFKKMWPDDWGPRLEHLLRNVVFTLLDFEGASFADIPRLLSDRGFRKTAVSRVRNPAVLSFWRDEFEGYSPAFRAVVTAPLLNKVGAFLSDPRLASILSAKENSFDLRKLMDGGKVLLVNLSKGELGEGPAQLLGSLLVSHVALAGLSRADTAAEERRDFHLYLDEFQTFSTLSLATMLSELRKFRVCLVLAHQYLSQLEPEVRDAVFGNVGTFLSFRVGALDAPTIARELHPFTAEDLISLPNFNFYLRLLVDGQGSRTFSGKTSREA